MWKRELWDFFGRRGFIYVINDHRASEIHRSSDWPDNGLIPRDINKLIRVEVLTVVALICQFNKTTFDMDRSVGDLNRTRAAWLIHRLVEILLQKGL